MPLRIGIVGAGLRGRLFAEALAGRPDVTVTGFAEPSPQAAANATQATGLPVVGSHAALLDLGVDAVIVATPDFAHRDVAVDLAEAGKHLLIEKPLATDVAEARDIVTAVEEAGVRCLVGFENRWNPHVISARNALDGLGAPITASATLSNSYFVPTMMLSWAAKSSPLWFLMPHTVDLLMHLTGRTPVSVFAAGSRGVLAARGIDTWDVVHATLVFDDGTTGSLSSSWVLPDTGEGIVDFRFQVIAAEGAVSADLSHQGLQVVTDRARSAWPLGSKVGRSPAGPAPWMANDFATGLIDGSDLGPDARHGLLVTEVIAAVEASLTSGRVEAVTDAPVLA